MHIHHYQAFFVCYAHITISIPQPRHQSRFLLRRPTSRVSLGRSQRSPSLTSQASHEFGNRNFHRRRFESCGKRHGNKPSHVPGAREFSRAGNGDVKDYCRPRSVQAPAPLSARTVAILWMWPTRMAKGAVTTDSTGAERGERADFGDG